jgi:hypothetical protein
MYVKGMVQVLGTTYRVSRLKLGSYEVVRIHDELTVGRFECSTTLQVTALAIDEPLMKLLAAAAVQNGRTSWMGPRRSS